MHVGDLSITIPQQYHLPQHLSDISMYSWALIFKLGCLCDCGEIATGDASDSQSNSGFPWCQAIHADLCLEDTWIFLSSQIFPNVKEDMKKILWSFSASFPFYRLLYRKK